MRERLDFYYQTVIFARSRNVYVYVYVCKPTVSLMRGKYFSILSLWRTLWSSRRTNARKQSAWKCMGAHRSVWKCMWNGRAWKYMVEKREQTVRAWPRAHGPLSRRESKWTFFEFQFTRLNLVWSKTNHPFDSIWRSFRNVNCLRTAREAAYSWILS